ncbi:hypothetical protein [Actinoplanes sp. HUAS TT8]|uniref:hypothetical protein n=1 Tax=Actinoplanes sp. HUAS TT8 TaxID=3447453 RepID=UPI003F51E852
MLTYLAHARTLADRHGPGPWPHTPFPDGSGAKLISDTVMDGIRTHHSSSPDDTRDVADRLAARIHDLVPSPATLQALHDTAAVVSPVDIADGLIRELRRRRPPKNHIRLIGRWLAENGTRRGAVALGIVLLGLGGEPHDRDLLQLLGQLEDFTLYAVVALRSTQPDPDQAVFELARRVDGWGRIHAVERLAGTTDPAIKAWLLRDGFRNRILDEYLAWIAATTGGLADALAADSVDEQLLDGAGGILLALWRRGPARDIDDYPEGTAVTERFLHHAGLHRPTVERVGVVGSFATVHGLAQALALTRRPEWRDVVVAGLAAEEPDKFDSAVRAAQRLGLPFGSQLVRQVRARPNTWHLWYHLVDDPAQIDTAVELAVELLPLDALVTGPGLDRGLAGNGPEHILDLVVSRLDTYPGKGWNLIATALRNATVRNRNMALDALEAWPVEVIPDEAWTLVREAVPVEPDPGVRERLSKVLARQPRT